MALLEVKNLSISFGGLKAVDNFHVEIEKGQLYGLIGPNGAGKTTFSRAVCGLHKEIEGKIFLNNTEQSRKDLMKRSYLVMQDVNYELFAESVEQESIFGIKNPDKELAKATLEELDLAQFSQWHPNTLSGGQKQRLAVAVSMICRKDLLVFDEPTSGLDFDSMVRLAALIQRLSKLGKIIFIVTHDYEFVCRTCKRVLHLDDGRIQDNLPVTEESIPMIKEIFDVRRTK